MGRPRFSRASGAVLRLDTPCWTIRYATGDLSAACWMTRTGIFYDFNDTMDQAVERDHHCYIARCRTCNLLVAAPGSGCTHFASAEHLLNVAAQTGWDTTTPGRLRCPACTRDVRRG